MALRPLQVNLRNTQLRMYAPIDSNLQDPPGQPFPGGGGAFEPCLCKACILLAVHLRWHVPHAMLTLNFISRCTRGSYFS